MFPSRMWKGLVTQTQDQALTELLTINETIRAYGLVLTPHDVKHLISARNEALHNYGRIEFGFDVSRRLIEEFAPSPYIDAENFVSVLHELHDIFYYFKNETEDDISDATLIDIMRDRFNGHCAGSVDLLKSSLEAYAKNFRKELHQDELFAHGGDDE